MFYEVFVKLEIESPDDELDINMALKKHILLTGYQGAFSITDMTIYGGAQVHPAGYYLT